MGNFILERTSIHLEKSWKLFFPQRSLYSQRKYQLSNELLKPRHNSFVLQNRLNSIPNGQFRNSFLRKNLGSLYEIKPSYCTDSSDDLKHPLDLFDQNDEDNQLVPRSLRTGNHPHQVLIIHPHIKWGPNKKFNSSVEQELEEAESLIRTLKDWKIISAKKISLLSYDSHTFFNSGQLEKLKALVKDNENISCVFINVKNLKLNQHLFLEDFFNVPIFDRHSIVINIFKRHAISNEAKLQVSLAEIPYIRSRVRGINDLEMTNFTSNIAVGSSESHLVRRLQALSFHEQKLKKSIIKLRKNRELLRAKRKLLQLPVVAVVGYTNAGKTSLIKCLTEEERMQPEDKLFATLDVTVHAGILPCNLKVLYIDTIGFISDIPTNLLEPFIATLEDAMQADLIVHVQDVSHSSYQKQKDHVLDTLKSMNLDTSLLENVISVGNKCDKAPNFDNKDNTLLTSCTKQTGLVDLELDIEQALVKKMGLRQLRIKVESGGREYQWLYKEAAIANCIVDENDHQYILLDCTLSSAKLEQFKHYFIRQKT